VAVEEHSRPAVDVAEAGRWLEHQRISRDLSIRLAARRAGVSDTQWRYLEAGSRPRRGGGREPVSPRAGTLLQISQSLHIEPAEMLGHWGLDLNEEIARGDQDDGSNDFLRIAEMYERIQRIPAPVIAAVLESGGELPPEQFRRVVDEFIEERREAFSQLDQIMQALARIDERASADTVRQMSRSAYRTARSAQESLLSLDQIFGKQIISHMSAHQTDLSTLAIYQAEVAPKDTDVVDDKG
jgi:transcriptional regulator with XRE-family HTH domain